MGKIGRNEPCPCGSGKKFKKCHMGREGELRLDGLGEISLEEMGERITALPLVNYGRAREMVEALDIRNLTGSTIGIRFVDLKGYADLNLFGGTHREASQGESGGVFINLHKTVKADPDHVYLAISRDIEDSSLTHELAHVLDFLGGSGHIPGTSEPLGFELGIPVEHLEHPEEFGYWLDFLQKKFDVTPDADDTIISYLYKKGMLIKGGEIEGRNALILKSKSDAILRCLSEDSEEIDGMIRNLRGYIGPRKVKD